MKRIAQLLVLMAIVFITGFILTWNHVAAKLCHDVLNNNLEGKICALQTRFGCSNIIIAGDSRAQYQIIPEIFEKEMGRSTVNLAVTAGDLPTLYNALYKHPDLVSNAKLLVISIGIYQINDGSIDYGFLSMASFINLNILDHAWIYWKRPNELWQMYNAAFRFFQMRERKNIRFNCGDYWIAGFDVYVNKGFTGHSSVWGQDVETDPMETNTWYQDLRIQGSRWRQFKETLGKFQNLGLSVVVYQSPYCKAWLNKPITKRAASAEKEYGNMIRKLTKDMKNVYFFDYFSSNNESISDSMFFDQSHLNTKGAENFTHLIIEDIKNKNILASKI